MDPIVGGASWSIIPSVPSPSNVSTPSNKDLYFHQQQPPPPQQTPRQPLASRFHLVHLVEKSADAIDNGTRDQNSDALINELNNQFEKCQQFLNSISGSISTEIMTVEGQKQKLEDSEQLLIQQRDMIANHRSSLEVYIRSERLVSKSRRNAPK